MTNLLGNEYFKMNILKCMRIVIRHPCLGYRFCTPTWPLLESAYHNFLFQNNKVKFEKEDSLHFECHILGLVFLMKF